MHSFLKVTLAISGLLLSMAVSAQVKETILSDSYVTSQEFVEAEVLRVQPKSRTITVKGVKNGDTRQFSVAEGTRITIQGKPAMLRDVRRGDKVLLAMTPQSDKVVISRVRIPETAKSVETRRAEPVVVEVAPTVLPKTASAWPTVLVVGLLCLGVASFSRKLRTTV